MRRVIFIAIPLLAATIFFAAWLVIEARRPPEWQAPLSQHLDYKASTASETFRVGSVVRAAKPWNFSPETSRAAFGDSVYYQTMPYHGAQAGSTPLPYPPERVWCVSLERVGSTLENEAEGQTTTIVFVAFHQDLYNADIVVHEPADNLSGQKLSEALSEIGCDFR